MCGVWTFLALTGFAALIYLGALILRVPGTVCTCTPAEEKPRYVGLHAGSGRIDYVPDRRKGERRSGCEWRKDGRYKRFMSHDDVEWHTDAAPDRRTGKDRLSAEERMTPKPHQEVYQVHHRHEGDQNPRHLVEWLGQTYVPDEPPQQPADQPDHDQGDKKCQERRSSDHLKDPLTSQEHTPCPEGVRPFLSDDDW